ncbi:MAG: SepM family pheromone-processing serine protease [Bacillota bacterium]
MKRYGMTIVLIAFMLVGTFLPLPYYIYRPGTADPLNEVVTVSDRDDQSETGDFHLVTIRGGQATPIQLLLSQFSDYQDVYALEDVFPEGYDRDDYMREQLLVMENSQQAATLVAYDLADVDYTVNYEGVYVVDVLEGMPAADVLEAGDKILEVSGEKIKDANHLITVVDEYDKGDALTFTVKREAETFDTAIALVPFPDQPENVGIGIQLVTNREVSLSREVEFFSGDIGGPSAGLVLALELYDQLTAGDLTHGKKIAGTGEVDYDGNVGRIGGVDKKVVAADKEGCEIFFAPNEKGRVDSNYQLAKQTKEAIDSDMVIVPVDTVSDALDYLNDL